MTALAPSLLSVFPLGQFNEVVSGRHQRPYELSRLNDYDIYQHSLQARGKRASKRQLGVFLNIEVYFYLPIVAVCIHYFPCILVVERYHNFSAIMGFVVLKIVF